MTHKTDLYFEAHVTTAPIPDERRQEIENLARPWSFRLAKLTKQNGQTHSEDAFLTTRSVDYADLCYCVQGVVRMLRANGIEVRRYKIEDTLLDSNHEASGGDVWGLL